MPVIQRLGRKLATVVAGLLAVVLTVATVWLFILISRAYNTETGHVLLPYLWTGALLSGFLSAVCWRWCWHRERRCKVGYAGITPPAYYKKHPFQRIFLWGLCGVNALYWTAAYVYTLLSGEIGRGNSTYDDILCVCLLSSIFLTCCLSLISLHRRTGRDFIAIFSIQLGIYAVEYLVCGQGTRELHVMVIAGCSVVLFLLWKWRRRASKAVE